jgi:predicted ribosomally synthesized peptide with SipW-like signal peptide
VTRKLLLTLLVLGGLAAVSGVATYSAFSSQTSNTGNSFTAGTVLIADNDLDNAMLSLSNAQPGSTDTSCILVTYSGSLSSTVKLYGSIAGALAPYLTLTITRGDDPTPVFDDCLGFQPDLADYIGAGQGVIYQGALSSFPSGYATGLVDPIAGSPETWTSSESRVYRFVVSVANDNNAQGQSATASFTWEAQNQ